MGRPDWQQAAKVPLALLPAGSGNAMSANTGMWDLSTALHAVIKVIHMEWSNHRGKCEKTSVIRTVYQWEIVCVITSSRQALL